MRITANDISFNYTIEGKAGAPWLIFSNALATNLSLWEAQVEVLKQSFQIVRYDQRGHGATTAPDRSYTFDLLARDALALLDALKIEQAHFVGISMGGVTALSLATLAPHRLASLVLSNAQSVAPPTARVEWEERITLATEGGMDALVEPTIKRWFRPEFVAASVPLLHKVGNMIQTTPVQGFIGCARALQQYDFQSVLCTIEVPTLFIVGAQDGLLPQKMQAMHDQVRGSTLVVLDQAGHIPNIEQPEAFSRALRNFLTERIS